MAPICVIILILFLGSLAVASSLERKGSLLDLLFWARIIQPFSVGGVVGLEVLFYVLLWRIEFCGNMHVRWLAWGIGGGHSLPGRFVRLVLRDFVVTSLTGDGVTEGWVVGVRL
ncbi:hypothetical protein B0J12DRAFT_302117 [Macrophomina phaseolina]|uniref:Uncharacterized protein n=1 Tax=Macrophomina phaseolina TaxID=35725 RepID=A0ABQ8FXJ4_9PEZI|nr:hypothetical protein B0J12DRAFT_302117 [Macrophomina phaseolina]